MKLRQAVVWRCKLARNVIMICHLGFSRIRLGVTSLEKLLEEELINPVKQYFRDSCFFPSSSPTKRYRPDLHEVVWEPVVGHPAPNHIDHWLKFISCVICRFKWNYMENIPSWATNQQWASLERRPDQCYLSGLYTATWDRYPDLQLLKP